MPAGNHGICNHHLGLGICFDKYHDSLLASLIDGIGHWAFHCTSILYCNEHRARVFFSGPWSIIKFIIWLWLVADITRALIG